MMNKLINATAGFCMATVLTQVILLTYFLFQGSLNGETSTKIIALLNGIDISGDRIEQALLASEDYEQPDFDEVLEARKLKSYDMDMRLRSQKLFSEDLTLMLAELTEERTRFDERFALFQTELEEIKKGAQKEGIEDVQRTIQSLEAIQAKQQLLIMYEDKRIDEVVTILQAMPTDKRKDILAEFATEEEAAKLAEILRRIGEGMPTTTLIDEASQNR
ncbi:MAG: hypothetical protein P8L85_09755 [Rubripirellula sp.]|nr:hypothetical protein [Rubripirellula sp.]